MCSLDDLVEVGFVGDAVEHLVGPDEQVGDLADLLRAARAETGGPRDGDLVGRDPPLAELLLQRDSARRPLVPAAALAGAVEDFVPGDLFDRPVEHPIQQRLAAEDVRGEDLVDQPRDRPAGT